MPLLFPGIWWWTLDMITTKRLSNTNNCFYIKMYIIGHAPENGKQLRSINDRFSLNFSFCRKEGNNCDKPLNIWQCISIISYRSTKSAFILKSPFSRNTYSGLSGIVRQHGFTTVQDFYTAFYTAQRTTDAYQKEC